MAYVTSAASPKLPLGLAASACEPIKPDASKARLGDLSRFVSHAETCGGVSSAATTCDCLAICADRQISQTTSSECSDASSLDDDVIAALSAEDGEPCRAAPEQGAELHRGEIISIVQSVVKNSEHAASLVDPADPGQQLLAVSEAFQEMSGYHESELLQASSRVLTEGCEHETDPEVQAAMRSSHSTGSPLLAQAVNRSKQGWLFWNTMYIRGLMVAVDPVSQEPIWLVLTTHSGSEEPLDEDGAEEGSSGGALSKLRSAGEDLRAEIHDELARRCAGGACRPAESEVDAPPCPEGDLCVVLPRKNLVTTANFYALNDFFERIFI